MAFFQFLNDCNFFISTFIDFAKTPLERGEKRLQNEPKLAPLALHVT